MQDHYDIKMLTYLMVARVSQLCPGAVLQKLDKLVEPLKLTCTTKVASRNYRLIVKRAGFGTSLVPYSAVLYNLRRNRKSKEQLDESRKVKIGVLRRVLQKKIVC